MPFKVADYIAFLGPSFRGPQPVTLIGATSGNGYDAAGSGAVTDLTASGTINAAQPTAGTPVTGGTVALALGAGQSSWSAEIVPSTGGFTGASTIVVDSTIDGTNWNTDSFVVAGGTGATVQSVVGTGAAFALSGNCADKTQIRIRCSVLNTSETATVVINASVGTINSSATTIATQTINLNTAIGTPTQTKATDGTTTAWSVIQIAKGILDKLLGTLAVTQAVGTALTPWASQPTQTAAAGADTQLKWGSGGTTPFTHCSIQNNTAITVYYAFDQSAVTSGNQIYTLAPGAQAAWDRNASILHFASASQQNIGGQSGITAEAFA